MLQFKPGLILLCVLLSLGTFFGCLDSQQTEHGENAYDSWSSYLGGPDRNHYSTLSQINKENVSRLKMVWSYSAPDWGQMQMNPIVVDTILYGVTAALRAVALHAKTGKELWRFGDSLKVWHSTSRGVAYWAKGADKRILYTMGSDLYALNAMTGKPVNSFGQGGKIDLRSGLPPSAKDKFVISNTPGTTYKDLIVMPIRVSEDAGAAPGDIMAFNILTGEVAWVFHTIPYPGEPGYESWENKEAYRDGHIGAGNNWAGMALDVETGIIYIPTGSIAPDFYGGHRKGSNLYSDCLLALDAATGKLIWHFQFTHHDIWDRDLPAPPNLITLSRKGQKIPAVAQVTKQGYVYVFDRRTGEPLFDIEEVPVPESHLEGEQAWKTQPIPTKPEPFARLSQNLGPEDISPYAENKEELMNIMKNADKRQYAPPNISPVLLLPGYDGAAEWGGASADPEEGILYVNANEMAFLMQMEPKDHKNARSPGEAIYQKHCASCHQKDRTGVPASGFPSLLGLKSQKNEADVALTITQGKGMMTGFPQLTEEEKKMLLQFLFDREEIQEKENLSENPEGLPYQHMGYTKFLDKQGLPAISPPWGTLHAIDLNTGNYRWSVPFGETPTLKAQGYPRTGTENYGGAVITQNGLLFIGATKDGFFRAFDKHTGKILWEYQLPAAAFATPATYMVDKKQYVVIACGGEKLGTEKGNKIIAFALD